MPAVRPAQTHHLPPPCLTGDAFSPAFAIRPQVSSSSRQPRSGSDRDNPPPMRAAWSSASSRSLPPLSDAQCLPSPCRDCLLRPCGGPVPLHVRSSTSVAVETASQPAAPSVRWSGSFEALVKLLHVLEKFLRGLSDLHRGPCQHGLVGEYRVIGTNCSMLGQLSVPLTLMRNSCRLCVIPGGTEPLPNWRCEVWQPLEVRVSYAGGRLRQLQTPWG